MHPRLRQTLPGRCLRATVRIAGAHPAEFDSMPIRQYTIADLSVQITLNVLAGKCKIIRPNYDKLLDVVAPVDCGGDGISLRHRSLAASRNTKLSTALRFESLISSVGSMIDERSDSLSAFLLPQTQVENESLYRCSVHL